ncbi:hypothetical protein BZA05DRAFT_384210 [Tricharina praecox]|uniref:uncharacterized protein n=1 Tax=Tricharina praecox TaxID=43433 RepID=UPI00221EAA52|nr:uncharacterized protein BZA05DRAFT_384210 [Tricharina praecox]KAI5857639.1 hypothetical protein BZA05DRAFT_384210 [Tricharina praecox]
MMRKSPELARRKFLSSLIIFSRRAEALQVLVAIDGDPEQSLGPYLTISLDSASRQSEPSYCYASHHLHRPYGIFYLYCV